MALPIRTGKVEGVTYTRTALLREQQNQRWPQVQKAAHRAFLHQQRSKSATRRVPPPPPPNTPATISPSSTITRRSSDSELWTPTQFRRLLDEAISQKKQHRSVYGEACNIIKEESAQKRLFYRFFRALYPADPRERFTIADVKELLSKGTYSHNDIYCFYARLLFQQLAILPFQIGLTKNSPIKDLERGIQAANNFNTLICAIDRQFREIFEGPSEKVPYFFARLEDPLWKRIRRLDLTFQPFVGSDSIGFTWLPKILSTMSLPALQECTIAEHPYLVELPKGLFPDSSNLRSFKILNIPISRFPEDFGKAWHLEELHCHDTDLKILSQVLQENTPDLKVLDLSYNLLLARVDGDPSKSWHQIERIELLGTNISSFPFTFSSNICVTLPNVRAASPSEQKSEEVTREFQSVQKRLIQNSH